VSNIFVEKYKKPKKYQTEQIRTAEESDIIDPRIKIDLQTRELILKYRLTNRIQPTLSIPLAYNSSRGVFELIETPSLITSHAQGYYYSTLPTETTPDYYNLALDAQHRLYVKEDILESKITPILKASLFNQSVTANTNILSNDVSPTSSPTTFRIYAAFNTQGILSITRTKGSTTVTEQLNGGYTLNANAAYTFDVVVEQGETINLQYSANATALVLKVLEISGVIA
jgi:hypothetical protein